ncbi:hypothetical protein CDAR_386041 [Caerostris darwini]|uniref:Uncharacterized protein n=1 Tax=Caerostris darwini TaxID=1538125 RepID=A0AAV4RRN2_9ARAC|nr:hypothetical protein CDAR_386041 [Caerostris darwini]
MCNETLMSLMISLKKEIITPVPSEFEEFAGKRPFSKKHSRNLFQKLRGEKENAEIRNSRIIKDSLVFLTIESNRAEKELEAKRIELGVRPDFEPGVMETAEDERWVRMERAETIDHSVRESAPAASNPELMDTTSASIPSELLASPTFLEKQSNLSDEEHCARISTVIKKKDLAQNLYDAYAAALTGYSPDDDDLKVLKKHHDDLQLAMREVSKLELCPLPSCKKHKINNFDSQIKRNAAHLNNHEHDNDGGTAAVAFENVFEHGSKTDVWENGLGAITLG